MSSRKLVFMFILIQLAGSLNPDDRIGGLEKELYIVKTDKLYRLCNVSYKEFNNNTSAEL